MPSCLHIFKTVIQRHLCYISNLLSIVNKLAGLHFGGCCALHLKAWLGSRPASKGGVGVPCT